MEVFDKLRSLYFEKEKENLVIFVGAGISKYFANIEEENGFPSWDELVKEFIIDDLKETKCIDYLKTMQIYEDTYSREVLINKVKERFPKKYKCGDIHKLIFDIKPAHIITTNYDNLLEKAMTEKHSTGEYHIVVEDKSIPLSNSKQKFILKAHGDLEKENIVLTEHDYNDYEKNFPLILSFIKYIFSKHKVLFIGFSLNDPNFNKILYWVKNILEQHSIEHTLISYDDISNSERKHFKNKSVDVITKDEIIKKLNCSENDYLEYVLKFVQYGFPEKNFTREQRLKLLSENILELKNFKYLLPKIVKETLKDVNYNFHYESLSETYKKNTKKEEKEKNFPYIANIYQKDSFINTKDIINLYSLLQEEKGSLSDTFLNDIYTLFSLLNIIYIGDIKVFDVSIPIKIDKINLQLPTYTFNENGIFIEDDLSFEKKYTNYDFFTFSKEDYYIDYLFGDKNNAYNKCKKLGFIENNNIEKYLYYFKLHYLFDGRKIKSYEDLDIDSFNVYENIFNIMTKHQQNILNTIHRLDFVSDFDNYITITEIEYKKYLKKEKNFLFHFSSDPNDSFHYKNSFYINYSRFLKFILLNRLPILQEFQVQNVIHRANKFYFNNFTNEDIKISNWNLIGFLLDSNESAIKVKIINKYNKEFNKPIFIDFNHSFVKEIFSNCINENFDDMLIKLKNVFYLISLSAKKEENFIFILDLFYKLITSKMKNLEYFSTALEISYINYTENNSFTKKIKLKLKKVLDKYLEYKLTSFSEKNKDTNDNDFSAFILRSLKVKYRKKDLKILTLLNGNDCQLPCQNLSSFIFLLKSMGYKLEEIQKNIITPIRNNFQDDEFYTRSDYPGDKCPNQIENSVVRIYKYFSLDIGVKKIEEHYVNKLLNESGNLFDNAISWIIYLIDENMISKEFYSVMKQKDVLQKFSLSLNHMFKKDVVTPFDNQLEQSRNLFVEFLLKTKNAKLITNLLKELNDEKNSYNFIKMFIYLINKPKVINNYKSNLVEILNYFDNTKFKNIILPVKYLLLNHKGLDDRELKNILLNILENEKDNI